MNDLTPFYEVCRKHVLGFEAYKPICIPYFPQTPYILAQSIIKKEYWRQYLDLAISIAYSCNGVDELLKRLKELNSQIPSDWYNTNIVL